MMKKTAILASILLLILFVSGCEQYDSIKSIAQNPKSYVGSELTIRGKYDWTINSIVDSDGYRISIDGGGCTESSRTYVQGATYKLTGTIKENYYPSGLQQYEYTFQCSEPMN